MTTPRVSEKVVQQHIIALLRTVGAMVYVLGHPSPSDGRAHRGTGQTPGVSDLLVFLPPKPTDASDAPRRVLVFIEVKAAGGRLRTEQARFRELAVLAGVAHILGDLDAVIAWLLREQYLRESQVPHYRLPQSSGAPANG